ncbi:hypothetical protein A3Q56_06940 [Intoshia linei]|uniref:Uncharacterized protein n=1 Tax=Intoshia linei TaxID=1819745 RepID=A0A177AVE1_9BILA|nr:hypothetical protein A3Q56_06940 [Intoshia linei]
MYLHDIADIEASFTKEEMQMGKHTDYEKYLINLNEKGFLVLSTIQKNAHSFDSERFTYSRKKSIGSDTNSNNSSSISNYTDHINISFSRSENGVPLVSIKDCLYGTVSLSTIVNYIKNEYPYYDRVTKNLNFIYNLENE